MALFPDVALVIQGPVKESHRIPFVDAMPYYKTLFDEIILSTYTEHLTDELRNFCMENNIILVEQSVDIGDLEIEYHIMHQTLSTLEGLKKVTKKYTLRHRSDERYSHLDRLIELFMRDDNKWVSSSCFVEHKSFYPYHAGDHLFICKTEKLLKCFELCKEKFIRKEIDRNYDGGPMPEVNFTKNFLRANVGVEPTNENHDQLMLENFDVLNDIHLYPFIISFNSIKQIFTEIHHLKPAQMRIHSMRDII